MEFVIGTRVEVIQNEEGLEGAYFAGVVIDRSPGMRKVRFETLLNDDGTPLEESVSTKRNIRFHHEWSAITNRSNETANCWILIKR